MPAMKALTYEGPHTIAVSDVPDATPRDLDGAVVRRREEISILRSLGVTEKIIRQLWLLEAGLLGLLGGIFGALLGWAGAQIAVRFVGRTVNALYFSTTVQSARLDGGEFILALVIALG